MANYNSVVFISKEKAELIRHYIDDEPTCREEAFINDYICYTAIFPHGFEMDLMCCGVGYYEPNDVNSAWAEALLVHDGWEVADEILEGSGEFFSPTTLKDGDGNSYTTYVVIKED